MQILGDQNAILKDLTEVAEAEIMDRERQLYPLLSTDLRAADQAYVKVPIQTKVPFPTLFDGEGEDTSTEVAAVQEYTMGTYMLRLGFGSDLMRESKAYDLASKTQEGTMSAKMFPSYNMTQMIISSAGNLASTTASGPTAFDGKQMYVPSNATTGAHFWPGGTSNRIINSIAATGTTVAALWADLQSAVALLKTYRDNAGRLLNPMARFGNDQLLIHCPVALEAAFTTVLHGGFFPVTVPVTTSGTAAAPASGPSTMTQFRGIADIFADGYLDTQSASRWYLHYVGMPQRPWAFGESYGLQGRALGPGTEYETTKNRVAIILKHRFLMGAYRFDRTIRIG